MWQYVVGGLVGLLGASTVVKAARRRRARKIAEQEAIPETVAKTATGTMDADDSMMSYDVGFVEKAREKGLTVDTDSEYGVGVYDDPDKASKKGTSTGPVTQAQSGGGASGLDPNTVSPPVACADHKWIKVAHQGNQSIECVICSAEQKAKRFPPRDGATTIDLRVVFQPIKVVLALCFKGKRSLAVISFNEYDNVITHWNESTSGTKYLYRVHPTWNTNVIRTFGNQGITEYDSLLSSGKPGVGSMVQHNFPVVGNIMPGFVDEYLESRHQLNRNQKNIYKSLYEAWRADGFPHWKCQMHLRRLCGELAILDSDSDGYVKSEVEIKWNDQLYYKGWKGHSTWCHVKGKSKWQEVQGERFNQYVVWNTAYRHEGEVQSIDMDNVTLPTDTNAFIQAGAAFYQMFFGGGIKVGKLYVRHMFLGAPEFQPFNINGRVDVTPTMLVVAWDTPLTDDGWLGVMNDYNSYVASLFEKAIKS